MISIRCLKKRERGLDENIKYLDTIPGFKKVAITPAELKKKI